MYVFVYVYMFDRNFIINKTGFFMTRFESSLSCSEEAFVYVTFILPYVIMFLHFFRLNFVVHVRITEAVLIVSFYAI